MLLLDFRMLSVFIGQTLNFNIFPGFYSWLSSSQTKLSPGRGEGGGDGLFTPCIIPHTHKSVRQNLNSRASSPTPSPTSAYLHHGPAQFLLTCLSSLPWPAWGMDTHCCQQWWLPKGGTGSVSEDNYKTRAMYLRGTKRNPRWTSLNDIAWWKHLKGKWYVCMYLSICPSLKLLCFWDKLWRANRISTGTDGRGIM